VVKKELELLKQKRPFIVATKPKSQESYELKSYEEQIKNYKRILKQLFIKQDNKYIRQKIIQENC